MRREQAAWLALAGRTPLEPVALALVPPMREEA